MKSARLCVTVGSTGYASETNSCSTSPSLAVTLPPHSPERTAACNRRDPESTVSWNAAGPVARPESVNRVALARCTYPELADAAAAATPRPITPNRNRRRTLPQGTAGPAVRI